MPAKRNTVAKVGKGVVTFGGDDERGLPNKRGQDAGEDNPEALDFLSGRPATAPPLLTVQEVAAILRCSVSSLNKWRLLGRGPRFVRVGSRVRYVPSDVIAYVREQTRSSTSQTIHQTEAREAI